MVLKFHKHGSLQIGHILGFSIIDYYYIVAFSLSSLITERTMKALSAYKIQSSSKLKNSVNQ